MEKEAKSIVGKVMHNSLYTWDKYALKEDIDKRKEAKLHKSKEK